MCGKKNTKVYYIIIILYGIILAAILLGCGNLYGSMTDWLGQHVVFPELFRQVFYESGQLIPNFLFQIGGGQNAFHFTYYGFLSPVILISYLLPFVDMTAYIIGASFVLYLMTGISVFIFLKRHLGERKAFVSAILYLTLSPVNYHFHHHIMFVWYLPFLILGLIGLDSYFEKKKRILFIASAFCMILTNYYFSVGSLVCLFVYAFYNILKEEKCTLKYFWKKFWQVVYLFLIPVLLSAFVLFPTAYGLFSNSRSYGSSESVSTGNVVSDALGAISEGASTGNSIMDVVGNIWKGIENLILPNLQESFLDNFSMGITGLMLVAVIGNLTCKNRKKCDVFLYGFLLALVAFPLFSYLLNGMLYVRGKVLIPFAVLFVFALCQFIERSEQQEIDWKKTVGFTVLFVVVCSLVRQDNLLFGLYILCGLGAAIIFRKKAEILYLCTWVVLLAISFRENQDEKYVSVDFYEQLYSDEIEALMENTGDGWFRTNVSYQENMTANRTYGSKFYGTSIYSSTFNRLYQDFYENYMGNNERYRNSFLTSGARNELFYTFTGTRYIISEDDPGMYYEKVAEGTHLNLYENPSAYPIVYKSNRIMKESDFDTVQFPYTAEYLLTHTIVENGESTDAISKMKENEEGADYISEIVECDVPQNYQFVLEKKETYEIELDESYRGKVLYLTFEIANEGEFRNKQDIRIGINGVTNKLTKDTWQYYNGNTKFDYVISLEDTNTLTIEITKGLYDIRNLHMYTSPIIVGNYEATSDLQMDTFKSEISCSVNGKNGDYLVTSIPFDKGFSASINGEPAKVEVVNKAFVGLQLEEGENQIVIKYTSPLFKEGCLVSLLGVMLLIYELLRAKGGKYL